MPSDNGQYETDKKIFLLINSYKYVLILIVIFTIIIQVKRKIDSSDAIYAFTITKNISAIYIQYNSDKVCVVKITRFIHKMCSEAENYNLS